MTRADWARVADSLGLKLGQSPRVNYALIYHLARPVIVVIGNDATLRDLSLKHDHSIIKCLHGIAATQMMSKLLEIEVHLPRSVGCLHELDYARDNVLFPIEKKFECGLALVFLGDRFRKAPKIRAQRLYVVIILIVAL